MAESNRSFFRQILKSTAIIGSSNFLVSGARLLQMKVLALLLGPAGFGMVGLYHSVMVTAATIGGLGLSGSGVREVSQSSDAGKDRELTIAIRSLRCLTLLLGLVSAVVLFLFRKPVAHWVFGVAGEHQTSLGILSLGVFFIIINGSQMALLNGLRRVKELASANVFSVILGTAVTVTLVFIWGAEAVPVAVVLAALCALLSSWWYARRIPLSPVSIGFPEIWTTSLALLRLGSALMAGGLVMVSALFLTRVILLDELGPEAVGFFQVAWAIVTISVDFILKTMAVEYYPLLTSRIDDRDEANDLVNQQTEIALLLGGPLILGLMLCAPFVVSLLCTSAFAPASDLLRWVLFGNILKIVSWPMGFLLMAQARAKMFLLMELLWGISYLSGVYFGSKALGLNAVGYAFLMSYFIYGGMLSLVVRRECGFAWNPMNRRLVLCLVAAGILILLLVQQSGWAGYLFGGILFLVSGLGCLWRMSRLADEAGALSIASTVQRKLAAVLPGKG